MATPISPSNNTPPGHKPNKNPASGLSSVPPKTNPGQPARPSKTLTPPANQTSPAAPTQSPNQAGPASPQSPARPKTAPTKSLADATSKGSSAQGKSPAAKPTPGKSPTKGLSSAKKLTQGSPKEMAKVAAAQAVDKSVKAAAASVGIPPMAVDAAKKVGGFAYKHKKPIAVGFAALLVFNAMFLLALLGSLSSALTQNAANQCADATGTSATATDTATGGGAGAKPKKVILTHTFAIDFLKETGVPVNKANTDFVNAWAQAENPGNPPKGAKYNPLDTTLPMPGATPFNFNNGSPVLNYKDYADGVYANAATVLQDNMANIYNAMKSGKSAMADAQGLASSPWGTGQLVEQILSSGGSAANGNDGSVQLVSATTATGACPADLTSSVSGPLATRIVKIAHSQLGNNNDDGKYGGKGTAAQTTEWCALFTSWVWAKAGVKGSDGKPMPSVAYSAAPATWAAANGGQLLPPTATPKPGYAVMFGSGPSDSSHVAIVVQVLPNGDIIMIGGNQSGKVTQAGPIDPKAGSAPGFNGNVWGYGVPPGFSGA